MSKRDTSVLLHDMLEASARIIEYTKGMSQSDFSHDRKTIDAVTRNFEILGEAANKVPQSFQDSHPSIDWRRIIGTRNRIIHEYFGVDEEILWFIIQNELPGLSNDIDNVLKILS
jgi:uncharacterized protein with HEPN domain